MVDVNVQLAAGHSRVAGGALTTYVYGSSRCTVETVSDLPSRQR